tara:strand:+ start:24898 stop:25416 length:519 start_codon:yes stop_codon:yes gene_type:complete
MKHSFTPFFLLIVSLCFLTLASCKHETITNDLNWDLYEFAKKTDGYRWFNNSNAPLPRSSGSGHSAPLVRTRFNEIATTQLDSNGRVVSGITFPEGSVIVKELLNADESLERYAILYKQTNNEFSDANGWVWGYLFPDGSVSETALNKGNSCVGCHAQSGNIDGILMNKYYP